MENIERKISNRPYLLGVTGGIGSGKSTVCRLIESRGVRVFYADEVGKQILQSDPEAIDEIIAGFGQKSYRDDGSLDRQHIAAIVFKDDARLVWLNRIVHPRVRASFQSFVENHRDERLIVHESAIIYESGFSDLFDSVVVVDASLRRRIKWATAGGSSEDSFRARLSKQMPAEELRLYADYIVYNRGSVDDLKDEVEILLRSLMFIP